MADKIFLIGLPGSGKTTLGKQVARQLQLPFYDLDKEIEKSAGKNIEEIFKGMGEVGFRKLESTTLQHFCQLSQTFVMATGGGAPCFGDNLDVLKKSGTVIFLDVPAKTISERIIHEVAHRPLLKRATPDSLKDRIEFLRSQRISFYQQAHIIVAGDSISGEAIIERLSPRS